MTIQLLNADRSIDAVRLRIDERSGNLSACATPDNVEVMIRQDSFYWTNSLKKKPTAWQGQEVYTAFCRTLRRRAILRDVRLSQEPVRDTETPITRGCRHLRQQQL